jgi:hypothetical protein
MIVIKCTDGTVQVMRLAPGASESQAIAKWKITWPGLYESHRETPEDAIPEDRTYRGAWTDTSAEEVVDIDIDKAKLIHVDRIRAERDLQLAVLDVEIEKAEDVGDTVLLTDLRAKRQALRDLPEIVTVELAKVEAVADIATVQVDFTEAKVVVAGTTIGIEEVKI